MYKILMVCSGNICRSPTAHGFLDAALIENNLDQAIFVDSCGIHAGHEGESPDPRSQKIALENGVDISNIRSRKIQINDYEDFDLILAMDKGHIKKMLTNAPKHTHDKIMLYLDFTHLPEESEVPDPYYGGQEGFQIVVDLVKSATKGIIHLIKTEIKK